MATAHSSRRKPTPSASRPYSVAVADLTGDGEPDIVTTNYGGNSVSVLLNNGNGTFGQQQTFATDLSPVQTVVADVNGDGRPDLVTVSNHDSAIGVLLGNGQRHLRAGGGRAASVSPTRRYWPISTATESRIPSSWIGRATSSIARDSPAQPTPSPPR